MKTPVLATGHPSPHLSAESSEEAGLLGVTPRQYLLLVRLAAGELLASVARDLGMSVPTAQAHMSTLCLRLGARDLRDAVTLARLRGAMLTPAS